MSGSERQDWWLAAVLHELKGPLQRMRLLLVQPSFRTLPGEARQALEGELKRLETTLHDLQSLLELDALPESGAAPVDVADLLWERQRIHRVEAESAGQTLRCRIMADLPVLRSNFEWLGRCLDQLIRNAIAHAGPGAQITLGAEGTPEGLLLSVCDTGLGPAPGEDPAHWCEPFVRGQRAGGRSTGSGLGLAFAGKVASRLGGVLALKGKPGGGLCARITFSVETF